MIDFDILARVADVKDARPTLRDLLLTQAGESVQWPDDAALTCLARTDARPCQTFPISLVCAETSERNCDSMYVSSAVPPAPTLRVTCAPAEVWECTTCRSRL